MPLPLTRPNAVSNSLFGPAAPHPRISRPRLAGSRLTATRGAAAAFAHRAVCRIIRSRTPMVCSPRGLQASPGAIHERTALPVPTMSRAQAGRRSGSRPPRRRTPNAKIRHTAGSTLNHRFVGWKAHQSNPFVGWEPTNPTRSWVLKPTNQIRSWVGAPTNKRNQSGRRDSNSRRQPWQGCTLPLSYSREGALV